MAEDARRSHFSVFDPSLRPKVDHIAITKAVGQITVFDPDGKNLLLMLIRERDFFLHPWRVHRSAGDDHDHDVVCENAALDFRPKARVWLDGAGVIEDFVVAQRPDERFKLGHVAVVGCAVTDECTGHGAGSDRSRRPKWNRATVPDS